MGAYVLVRKDSYHDSVLLMRLSQALKGLAGVEDAVVAMGTPHNRQLLEGLGYAGPALASAGPNDLLIAVKGGADTLSAVEAGLDALLKAEQAPAGGAGGAGAEVRPTSLAAALKTHPESNLVLISVPGAHAAREARRALALGRHVMLFSDNVPLEDEIALKREGAARGLLVMGPDCGTAILNGMPLAFANAVRRGPVGIVGAAGTGIQEISCCIHRLGGGVSQAIGTGGRDLSEAVGGTMTLLGIAALSADPATAVLVVVSKPPAAAVAEQVIAALTASPRPCVVHFVGDSPRADDPARGLYFADSLSGAARTACRLAGAPGLGAAPPAPDPARIAMLASRLAPGAALRALFCGGTTGQEALVILTRAGLEVRSNLHKKGGLRVDGTALAPGHALLDLGDDVFTVGRPHPMIEPELRNERLALEVQDPATGLLLFDCVLGYGAHPDPAGVLAEGVERARVAARGRELVAVASVTGTPGDPQDFGAQVRRLEAAGITVEADNRSAAALAAAMLASGAGAGK
ncbi:MAG: acyl-CoA synthetase FdrA [Candidatus Eisenbacteria bacterium]|nr:acyl-CoA synthetase FdrA [Candidatus Eisenbacteria bacterium]